LKTLHNLELINNVIVFKGLAVDWLLIG